MPHAVKEIGMTFPRAGYLLAGLVAGLALALWLSTCAPGALGVVHALAVVASAAVTMLATAIGALMASDWHADVQSHQAWARLERMPAHLSVRVEVALTSNIDPRYLPSASDEALRQVFRTYRSTAHMARSLPALAAPERRLPTVVRLPSRIERATAKWAARKPAPQLQLVANGDIWRAWSALPCPRGDRTADVIVLTGSKNDDARSVPKTSVQPDGTDSVAAIGCRGPPRTNARRTGVAANPVVHDDLGQRISVGQAELDVIEAYLERELRELLGSLTRVDDRGNV